MNSSTRTALLVPGILAGLAGAQPDCNGWEFVPSPNPVVGTNILFDADRSAPDNVWAVGSATDDGIDSTPKTLAMRWDGAEWTIFPTPNPREGWHDLHGVLTFGPGDAWAVGSAGSGESDFLILRWTGEAWSVFDGNDNLRPGSLYAIDGVAPADAWAVGRTGRLSLVLHWDGSAWEGFPVPPIGELRNPLQGVSALASDDVWAVGFGSDNFGQWAPLAAHWDGTAWDSMTVPTHDALISRLRGVAAVAPDDVWAVGDYFDQEEGTQPLIVHWDGASWFALGLPIVPGGPAELRAIAAIAPDDIYAAGTWEPPGEEMTGLIMHYDGESWAIVEEPEVPGSHEWFRGMAAVPGGEVWAVGQFFNGEYTGTLAERRPACCAADFDGDGVVDSRDVLAFLNAWTGDDPRADFDGDGVIDTRDVLAFLNAWSAGC